MNTDDLTRKAVTAALEVIDGHYGKAHGKSPVGDALASELHKTIERAIGEHEDWLHGDIYLEPGAYLSRRSA